MKKVIYGAYGAGNIGDDLLLKSALLKHNCNREDSLVICYGKPRLSELQCKLVDQNLFIQDPLPYFGEDDCSLHFAGGGQFWSDLHCEQMLHVAKAMKTFGGSVHLERLGAQGCLSAPETVRELFSIADSSSVRDTGSAQLLESYGIAYNVSILRDYVLDLDARKYASTKDEVPIIAINHSDVNFLFSEEHRTRVLRIYKQLAMYYKGRVKFVYFPHVRHFSCLEQNDIVSGEWFWTFSAGLIEPLDFPKSCEEALLNFGRFSATIGFRYHLLVLSKLFEIPSLLLGDGGDHKYGAFCADNFIPHVDLNSDMPEEFVMTSCIRFIDLFVLSKHKPLQPIRPLAEASSIVRSRIQDIKKSIAIE